MVTYYIKSEINPITFPQINCYTSAIRHVEVDGEVDHRSFYFNQRIKNWKDFDGKEYRMLIMYDICVVEGVYIKLPYGVVKESKNTDCVYILVHKEIIGEDTCFIGEYTIANREDPYNDIANLIKNRNTYNKISQYQVVRCGDYRPEDREALDKYMDGKFKIVGVFTPELPQQVISSEPIEDHGKMKFTVAIEYIGDMVVDDNTAEKVDQNGKNV